ncbi:MFS transporter [Caldibacillus lycopersici]|uniref:MFS transporter n=1 Tax=Perspicuibacillus lycopersici TaxID=1325689 RepID=A0AAE3LRK6_9BACI|nr:MFS transporter [Perspicuibacillus lycopersici]MCU9614769.1 MFS transporter [Perspicuibacillus lycopersici]
MDKRVYFLMIISFVIGMVELIISGILDLIAEDLHVSLAQAGQLITVFALIFAVASPILLIMTAKVERKHLTLISLYIFFIGDVVTIVSGNYLLLFIGRVILAFSGALLIILCLVMAPSLVDEKYRGRAIGIVSMGVSASLVLGVPIGLVLGNSFGWRAPFVLITVLTVFSIVGVHLLMEKVEPKPALPLRIQLASLKNRKITFALLTTFLYMAGHTVLYAYFKPYLETMTGIHGGWVSIVYLIFGFAAVSGGGIGGTLADVYGSKKSIIFSLAIFSIVFFILPFTLGIVPIFIVITIVWGVLSWAISPAMQSYLIETSPETSEIQQSLNNSALHLGVAFGSIVGGIVVEQLSIEVNPMIGGLFIILSFITAILSIQMGRTPSKRYKARKEW